MRTLKCFFLKLLIDFCNYNRNSKEKNRSSASKYFQSLRLMLSTVLQIIFNLFFRQQQLKRIEIDLKNHDCQMIFGLYDESCFKSNNLTASLI